ncbi:peroxiredoxin [Paracoccus pacificus]|uniref:Glutathione-dependent peroxiredoxin n=1 Tax=Paracoccus pacificus TaxID=1463598 RepID=A0ABW4R3D5_9RHOB
MSIAKGSKLPQADLLKLGEGGPEKLALSEVIGAGRAVVFAVPGAFTPTCTNSHMPSFVKNAQAFRDKGVPVVAVTVNDPFVADAWAKATGATDAGITVLADADGAFTKAIGMDFDAAPAGLYGRSKRYAMIVDNGSVDVLEVEDKPGVCSVTGGDSILKQL